MAWLSSGLPNRAIAFPPKSTTIVILNGCAHRPHRRARPVKHLAPRDQACVEVADASLAWFVSADNEHTRSPLQAIVHQLGVFSDPSPYLPRHVSDVLQAMGADLVELLRCDLVVEMDHTIPIAGHSLKELGCRIV
jgi:hypothetical protein